MPPPAGAGGHNGGVIDTGLVDAVSRMLGVQVDGVQDARVEPLVYDAFLANRTVSRVSGIAQTPSGFRPWSLIQKLTEGPAVASAYLYDNGLREFRAHESGLLADLAPRLRAARAHGLHASPDGRLTLWLEDLGGEDRVLSRESLILAAGDLGRLAGRWRGRVPDHPWLFTGWIDRHGQPEAVAPARDRIRGLRDRRAIENRLGRGLDEVEALIDDQPRVAAILRSMPQTLCHHDAVGANVFAGETGGQAETVLIDWEMVGPGPAGADLASLLFSSARRGDLPARLAIETLPDARDAYLRGMEDTSGVTTDADGLAAAVDAAIALRWVLVRDIIVALADGTPVRRGSAPHESPGEAMEQLIELSRLLFAAAQRTRS